MAPPDPALGTPSRPPRLARWLLRRRRLGSRQHEIETDLQELFDRRTQLGGAGYAARRYWIDVLSVWRWRPQAVAMTAAAPRRRRELGMRQDITFAIRMFRRQPGIVLMTIAGLAVAIGISTAMFNLTNAVAWRGDGIRDPQSVYRISVDGLAMGPIADGNSPMTGNWSSIDFTRLRQTATAVDVTAAFSFQENSDFRMSGDRASAARVSVMPSSGSYFQVLGGQAALGRTLAPTDDEATAPKLLLLNYAFWKTSCDADPAIVGRTVWLDDVPFTVAGVAGRGFMGAVAANPPAMWTTFAAWADVWESQQRTSRQATLLEIGSLEQLRSPTALQRDRLHALQAELQTALTRWNRPVDVLGRLRPGVTREQAAAEVNGIARGLADARGEAARVPTVRLVPIRQSLRTNFALLASVTAILVVILLLVALACSNVANLLLANAASRRREIGTRFALGASRARIVRQLLTESLLIGVIGGLGGLVLSQWIAPVLARLLQFPPLVEVTPDLTVYLFATGVSLAAGLLAGLAPARYGWRGDVLPALQADRHAIGSVGAPRRLRSLLIGGQAAASVVLLVIAALLTRSLTQAASLDLGFDPDRLISIEVSFSRGYDSARTMTYWDAALDRLKQLPGVSDVALAQVVPFGSSTILQRLPQGLAERNDVSATYFDTMGMRMLRGRGFTAEEVAMDARVAVISEGLARRYWGDADPLGSTLDQVWGAPDERVTAQRKPAGTTVVGIVGESVGRLSRYDLPTIYLPFNAALGGSARMIVAANGDPQAAVPAVLDALTALDPSRQPRASLVRDGFLRELEVPRVLSTGALALGGSALMLAVIGLFGVTAFIVGQRRYEISIRLALGASTGQVVRMLLLQSLRPVLIGAACGLVLAFLSGQLIRGVLVGVSGHDPLAIAAAVAVLVAAAGAAALIPARHATRISPAETLKER